FEKIIELVKDRCTLLTDFINQAQFFFIRPHQIDTVSILSKWNDQKNLFFNELIRTYHLIDNWRSTELENAFKEIASVNQLKPGELMLPLRVMLVGEKFGPGVFDIASVLGKTETVARIEQGLSLLTKELKT
ncbi:MAG: glutamate--tRNA ligase, partial [Ginsengibacter sp.]